jgi:hypothetical protein
MSNPVSKDRGPLDRYRFTRLYLDSLVKPGTLRYSLWQTPSIRTFDTDKRHTVTAADIGHLDAIAYKYYQTEEYWWVLAWINRIACPITDMYIGQQLVIPDISEITTGMTSEVE